MNQPQSFLLSGTVRSPLETNPLAWGAASRYTDDGREGPLPDLAGGFVPRDAQFESIREYGTLGIKLPVDPVSE